MSWILPPLVVRGSPKGGVGNYTIDHNFHKSLSRANRNTMHMKRSGGLGMLCGSWMCVAPVSFAKSTYFYVKYSKSNTTNDVIVEWCAFGDMLICVQLICYQWKAL